MTYFLFILLGFVLGSTLFAYWIPRLFFKTDITKVPPDHNPGVANAYMQAGFFAGTLSLLCELFKGAVPVFLADRILDRDSIVSDRWQARRCIPSPLPTKSAPCRSSVR